MTETIDKICDTRIIDIMESKGLVPGAKLEITLLKDAAYYDGSTPAPTHNMEGYEKFDPAYHDDNDLRSNAKVVGFVYSINKENGRIVLTSSISNESKNTRDRKVFYVQNDAIFDYKIN